jgi:hypothetical protein
MKGKKSPERPFQKILKIILIMNFIIIIIDYPVKLFSNNFRNEIHNFLMCPKIFDKIMNSIAFLFIVFLIVLSLNPFLQVLHLKFLLSQF